MADMPRIHSTIWFGACMIFSSLALIFFVIPHYVIKPSNVRILVLSPDFWPYIVAGLMLIGGIALWAQYWFMFRKFSTETSDPVPGGWFRIGLVAILMVAYYLIMPVLGMVWSSVVAYIAFVGIIGLPRKVATVVAAFVLPIALYMFFAHAAGVPIPQAKFLVLP